MQCYCSKIRKFGSCTAVFSSIQQQHSDRFHLFHKYPAPLGCIMPRNDDFFLPNNVDYSEPCADDSNIVDGNIILPFGASLSVVCYLYLMWMYFVQQSPIFRRHPTTLAVYKCMVELIFIQMYIWIPFITTQKFYDDDNSTEPYRCSSSVYSAWLAFITQFSLVGSELCFFVISYDLRIAYTNPFSSYKENVSFFFWLVVGVSGLTSVILMFLGPRVYGMSDLGLVWIQKRREHGSPNYPKAVLYYIITVWVFLYSLWANLQYTRDGGKGFSKTVSNRMSIMQRSRKFTIGYVGYGSLVFLMEFISYATRSDSTAVNNTPAYLLAFRGVWGMGIILYSNYDELTWELLNPFHLGQQQVRMKEDIAMEKLLLQPHLNTALRAEILYFTTQGIMFAARDYGRQKFLRQQESQQQAGQNGASHPDSENSEFSMNEDSGVNMRTGGGRNERSNSTSQHTARFSLGAIYNRRSMPNQARVGGGVGGAATTGTTSSNSAAYADEEEEDDGMDIDATDMDMFTRKSIAMFERYNKEQNAAVNKEMEVAFEDETALLGLKRGKTNTPLSEIADRNSISLNPQRTYNPFHQTRTPGGRPMSMPTRRSPNPEMGLEMQPPSAAMAAAGIAAQPRVEGVPPAASRDEEYSEDRDSEAGDVEFGMNQHPSKNKNKAANAAANRTSARLQLWRRIEAPASPAVNRSMSNASERSVSTNSVDGHSSIDSLRSSQLSKALFGVLSTASDAAKSFFSSSQLKEFRFKDFCPKLFGRVRELSGIDNDEYAQSFEKTCKEKFSEGRSGAFMFFSGNERCIVKTTNKTESLALHGIMPQYVKHLEKNPNSLVCRFLGAHCITMYGNELYFVVMLNVFPTFPLSERYDLKGSWVNRHGFEYSRKSKRERMRRVPTESSPLYQDNDLQHKLYLELDVTHALAGQIRRDVLFLREMQLMDYSLLIGVRRERFTVLDNNNGSSEKDSSLRPSSVRGDRNSVMRDTDLSMMGETSASMASRRTSVAVARPTVSMSASVSANSDPDMPQDAFKRDLDGGMRARLVEGPGTYYIGIIDVLQEWNFKKKMERFLKMYFKQYDGDGLSAIEPVAYSERFWRGAVLDTFDGLEYDTEELLSWQDTDAPPVEDPEYLPA